MCDTSRRCEPEVAYREAVTIRHSSGRTDHSVDLSLAQSTLECTQPLPCRGNSLPFVLIGSVTFFVVPHTLATSNATFHCDCFPRRLTDSQPENVLYANKIWHTAGTQYGPSRDFRIARYPRASAIGSHNPACSRSTSQLLMSRGE